MASTDFEVLRICENGHAAAPGGEHCPECGAKVLSACPACGESIRVATNPMQRLSGALGFNEGSRPRYCAKCGQGFPWQTQAVSFLKDIGREASLSKDELAQYEQAVEDVAQNNARAVRSAAKVLAAALKLGKPAYAEACTLMREVASKQVLESVGIGG
jgi:hypothetical protein